MQLTGKILLVGALILLISMTSINRIEYVDKISYSLIDEYENKYLSDTVLHLTIQENGDDITYRIATADTREAAAKQKIQAIFKYKYHYILLISNLRKGIPVLADKQAEYRTWLRSYLKPNMIEIFYPDEKDSTRGIMEQVVRDREIPVLKIIYRNGKCFRSEAYFD